MNLDRFSGPGSTPARRRFWDKVQSAVMASRKVAGRNVTIDEHSGAGSVINAPDRTRAAGSVCPECPADSVTITLSGVSICEGCIELPDSGASLVITSGSIDGTYVLPGGSFADNGCCYELLVVDSPLAITRYFSTDCSGDTTPQDWFLSIWAGRYPTPSEFGPACQWAVYAWIEGPEPIQLLVFLGEPQASFSDPFSNTAACGGATGEFFHPCGGRSFDGGAADGGTAALTL